MSSSWFHLIRKKTEIQSCSSNDLSITSPRKGRGKPPKASRDGGDVAQCRKVVWIKKKINRAGTVVCPRRCQYCPLSTMHSFDSNRINLFSTRELVEESAALPGSSCNFSAVNT